MPLPLRLSRAGVGGKEGKMITNATQEDIEEHVYGEVLEDRLRELELMQSDIDNES